MSDTVNSLNEALSGRYRIESELGRGGMGAVFLAQDLRHGREVALKVVDPGLVHAVGAERFLQEIRIAATLQHPHILPLFDSGEAGGHLYYAMPFVEGRSLRDLLQAETQLPVERAVKIGLEVAAGLAHAHSRDIVHRDIKPENILLSGGYAVLADFGVASALSHAGGDKLTPSGLAMGSPSYMAPEQMSADGKVGGRTDVYALGCVLYEMLVGDPPFTGPTATVVMARHASDPVPSIRTVRSTVSPELEAVVMRCLAKVPADRYASAEEVAGALEGVGSVRTAAAAGPGAAERVATPPAGPPQDATPAAGISHLETSSPSGPPSGAHPPGAPPPPERPSFFQELKRRHVYQSAAVYGVVVLSLVQAAQLAFPTFGIEWAFDFVVMAAVLGFPLVLVLAWVYDLTRRGIRRTTPWATPLPEQLAAETARRRGRALALLGAGGAAVFVALYPLGYGETTVRLDPLEDEARNGAEQFLAAQGAVGTFREARHVDRFGRTMEYLQRSVGFHEARRLAEERIPVWQWHFRWFRPGEPEEWRVALGSGGRIVRFEHRIPETAPGANLEEAEAVEVAHAFLRDRGWEPDELVRVQAASRSLASRTDHTFAWQVPDLAIPWVGTDGEPGEGEGIVEVEARVQGDRVGLYSARLDIPQAFTREASRRSTISSGLLFAVLAGSWILATLLLLVLARRGRIQIRWGVPLAATAATALLGMGWYAVGFFPDEAFGYSTETPWVLFLGGQLLATAFFGLLFGVIALPLAVGSHAFGQFVWPERMEGWRALFRGRLRDPRVAHDLRYGVILAGVLLGWGSLSQVVQLQVPDIWGLVNWGALQRAGDLLPWAALPLHAGMEVLLEVLFLTTILAILCRYLKSAAAAVMIVAVGLAVLSAEGTYPAYVSASLGAVEGLLVAAALVAFGPLVVLAGLFVSSLVGSAASFLVLGDPGSLGIGLTGLAVALVLPALPIFLAESEVGDADGGPQGASVETAGAGAHE